VWPKEVAEDKRTIRDVELVASDRAEYAMLGELEIPISEPVETMEAGERVLKIITTGADAEQLKKHGFEPMLPRSHALKGGVKTLANSPLPEPTIYCQTPIAIDTADCDFPQYENQTGDACLATFGGRGLFEEIQNTVLSTGTVRITPVVIGGTATGARKIAGIRFGPPVGTTPIPTHYILATHHAREWMSTAIAVKMMRYLRDVTNGAIDPSVREKLQSAAVVIVPVVNPDGYDFTHDPNGDRSWRPNRNLAANVQDGTDINRNYAGNWSQSGLADNVSVSAGPGNWRGPSAASEPETQAIQSLFDSPGPFPQSKPLTAMSYHTYANIVIYSTGWKLKADSTGPACYPNANCLNPDSAPIRSLFGNHAVSNFADPDSGGVVFPNDKRYLIDQERSNGYTTTGDFLQYAQYQKGVMAVTPEFGGTASEFYPECLTPSQRITLLGKFFDKQKAQLNKLLAATANLQADYTQFTTGRQGPIYVWREKALTSGTPAAIDDINANPTVLVTRSAASGTTPWTATVNGVAGLQTFNLRRTGKFYNVFGFQMPNAMQLPCTITPTGSEVPIKMGGCTGTIDLCDPLRLIRTGGFAHFDRIRANGARDCGYKANTTTLSDSTLEIQANFGGNARTALLSFTLRWSAQASTIPIRLQREVPGFTVGSTRWEDVTTWPLEAPSYELRTPSFSNFGDTKANNDTLRSFAFESQLKTLPSGQKQTERFRFYYPPGTPGSFEVLDLIVSSREGVL
jgi:Zinc carboxypeptidase